MNQRRYIRSRVLRPDGKLINVVHHRGHLMVCATGCCCGHTERGHAPVPTDLYHAEWERRKLRNKVHLIQGGCLGPCPAKALGFPPPATLIPSSEICRSSIPSS